MDIFIIAKDLGANISVIAGNEVRIIFPKRKIRELFIEQISQNKTTGQYIDVRNSILNKHNLIDISRDRNNSKAIYVRFKDSYKNHNFMEEFNDKM